MGDLTQAIAARSAALAQPRAADYAAGNRTYQVRITGPATEPVYDRALRKLVRQPPELVYEGPARVPTVNPAGQTEETGAATYWSDARISIPSTTTRDPRINDLVTVEDNPAGQVGNLVNREFRVVGVTRGGLMSTGFTLACTSLEQTRQETG